MQAEALTRVERVLSTIDEFYGRSDARTNVRSSFTTLSSTSSVEKLLVLAIQEVKQLRADLQLQPTRPRKLENDFNQLLPVLARSSALLRCAPGQASINSSQRNILAFLLSHSKPGLWARLSSREIGAAVGLGDRAVRGALRDLEGRGLLVRITSSGRITTFDLSGLVDELERCAKSEEMLTW